MAAARSETYTTPTEPGCSMPGTTCGCEPFLDAARWPGCSRKRRCASLCVSCTSDAAASATGAATGETTFLSVSIVC